MRRLLVLLAASAALASPGAADAANTKLIAGVGPGFAITLRTEAGETVRRLEPGTYDITVNDNDAFHSFHLRGTGVDRATGIEFVGTEQWTVTLANGVYTFFCDAHPTDMRGTFGVGQDPPPPPSPPAPPPPAPAPSGAKKLNATVGPGLTIALRTATGALVRAAVAGAYRITVRDRSSGHSFHLIGPGVNKKTGIAFVGTTTWSVRLRAGTYRYICDVHPTSMRRSFRVR